MQNGKLQMEYSTAAPFRLGEARNDLPNFDEPWQAYVFSLTVALVESGKFDWPEWISSFGCLRSPEVLGSDEEEPGAYYEHWIQSLCGILQEKGVASIDEVTSCAERWRRAYLATPHGHPVKLEAGKPIF